MQDGTTAPRSAFVIVGGSMSQRSLLVAAQARGLDTCVVDGNPTAPLLGMCTFPVPINFLNIVEVHAALQESGIEPLGIASMGSDAAVMPTAMLCAMYGLPGLSEHTAAVVSNKRAMRDAFASASPAVPFAHGGTATNVDEAKRLYASCGRDTIFKPADASGQRGVSRVRSAAEVEPAFATAQAVSRTGTVVVESYLGGEEYTVSGFSVDGEYIPVTITERELFPAPPVGVCRAHRYPSGLTPGVERLTFAATAAAAESVGITAGPSYAQVRVESGVPTVIEIGARLGGGKDAELAQITTGIDQIAAVVELALGGDVRGVLATRPPAVSDSSQDSRAGQQVYGEVRFFVAPQSGTVQQINVEPALVIDGIHEAGAYFMPGSYYPPLQDGSGRLGYIVASAPTRALLDERLTRAEAAVEVEIL